MILPERWAKHLHSVYTGTLILVGLTLLGATLLLLGIIAYISIEEPKRLVAYNQTEIVLAPQPAEVFSHQTNLWIILPPISAIFNGMVTNAAVWVRGERFASGPAAALYLLRHSWLIIALGMMAAVAGWFELRRWRRRPKQESQMPAGDLRKGSENVRISGEG